MSMPDEQTQTQVPEISTSTLPKMFPISLLLVGLVGAAVVGASAYWFFFREIAAPARQVVIGIPYFPQQLDAVTGFKEGMARLGYVEGTDVRYVMAKTVVNPNMFEEIEANIRRMIVEEKVDVILGTLEHSAKIALDMTKEMGRQDIPIVFLTRFHDPIEYGLASSFKSSGNNATGVAVNLADIIERTLAFFKEINPGFKRLGIFTDGFMAPGIGDAYLEELERQTPEFGIQIVEYTTGVPPPEAEAEFHRIADTVKNGDIDGLFHIAGHFYPTQEIAESELATRLGIPMAAPFEDLPNGGTFSYSDEFSFSGAQAAAMVDKVLKGMKPSDIPIEFGGKSVLTLILGRARDAGVEFTDSMLFIAANKFEDGSDFPPIFHERE